MLLELIGKVLGLASPSQFDSTLMQNTRVLSPADREELEALQVRIRMILPPQYQETYEDVQPVSMGSASLKYGVDGKVQWDEVWGGFCDLAMAGGPPHKGTLLLPASTQQIEANPDRYREIAAEICRGISMVTGLGAEPSPVPGWVRVDCETTETAEWLARAIVMENVSVRYEGTSIDLPAGPHYRVEKEVKNVITAIAKTSHYWLDHMWLSQQREIGALFVKMAEGAPLIQPAIAGLDYDPEAHRQQTGKMAEAIHASARLSRAALEYPGWMGLECPDVPTAIWITRALVASNVFARRESTAVFLPVNPQSDPGGEIVTERFLRVRRMFSN